MGRRFWHKRYHPPGTPPGTLVAHRRRHEPEAEGAPGRTGSEEGELRPRFDRMVYDAGHFEELLDASLEECLEGVGRAPASGDGPQGPACADRSGHPSAHPGRVIWIHATAPGPEELGRIGERFGLHPLALEDVLNVPQRAKVEEYAEHLFLVVHMIRLEPEEVGARPHGQRRASGPAARRSERVGLRSEQVSLFLGPGFVITVQEHAGDVFEPVRERLRRGSPMRTRGADYLMYALVDAVVDGLFPVVEALDDRLQILEEQVERLAAEPAGRGDPGRRRGGREPAGWLRSSTLAEIHRVRRDLLFLRRILLQQEQMLEDLYGAETPLISPATRVYLRDVRDHSAQVLDTIHSHLDLAASLSDLYLSAASFRLGEITKVLTIIATIFIPLSFIAGVYGMNFDPDASPLNMPELRWPLGYPFALGLMAAVAGVMVAWFRRRGWL